MTDSAVLDTVLGLIFLFYALALLCSGLVEMIANWVKKRAKYLLRGIRDLLDDMPAKEPAVAEKKKGWAQNTAETVYLNSMVERQRYGEMLHAPVPTPPHEPATAVPAGAGSTALPPEQPVHRDKITLSDVMGGATRATVIQQVTDLDFCSTPGDPTKCAEEAANFLQKSVIPLGWSAPNPQDGIWGWRLKVIGLLLSVGAATLARPSGIACSIGSAHCVTPDVHQNLAPNTAYGVATGTAERVARVDSASMTFYLAQGKACRVAVIR
jgi:hypothetical protein